MKMAKLDELAFRRACHHESGSDSKMDFRDGFKAGLKRGRSMTKTQLQQALKFQEAKAIKLAAENDRLRHALEIEKANKKLIGYSGGNPTIHGYTPIRAIYR